MIRYLVVSIFSGVLFGLMDGFINANALAQTLFEIYQPIKKTSVNVVAGISIDLVYGFVMAGLFLLLYKSLPGEGGFLKGISFAVIAWFFRVIMHVASQWIMFDVPMDTLIYLLVTGLFEMLVLGMLYGLSLEPIK